LQLTRRKTGKPTPANLEIELLRKDGGIRHVVVSRKEVIWDGEKRFQALYQDITRRKQAETKIKELFGREKKLHERVEEEMRKQVEFTRAMVHELKTPLTSVIAGIELLADGVGNELVPKLIGNISRGASTMNTRVDTLMDLVKGEMNMLELNFNELDPLPFLLRIADEMALVASKSELSLVTDLPSSISLVWVDETRLEEVVLNLLTNAFKWSTKGGKITLSVKEKDAVLVVGIQDEGPGIASEKQQEIFKPYYRVTSESRVVGGLGLGLALCKTILDSHGGEIWVESEEGRGSTFKFSIPVSVTTK
jgi:signal transduction histidine kinase